MTEIKIHGEVPYVGLVGSFSLLSSFPDKTEKCQSAVDRIKRKGKKVLYLNIHAESTSVISIDEKGNVKRKRLE